MNHISIEGMDGVGKSTTCKLLAERLGYIFVEKPLHYLLDDSDDETKQYQNVAKRVNANPVTIPQKNYKGRKSVKIILWGLYGRENNWKNSKHFSA